MEKIVGKRLRVVNVREDEILFVCEDDSAFHAFHMQDCCEDVRIHDIDGDFQDVLGLTVVEALRETSVDWPDDVPIDPYIQSHTWTIHTFCFENGKRIRVRWLGKSNGYYSEAVYFGMTHKPYGM